MPIPGLVTAGASLLGQAFGAAGTEYSNRKAFERMREHDIEMFNLQKQDRDEQNRYNAPAAQVARLAAAGINPASVFGNGVPVAESSPVSGSASASAKGVDWNITSRMAQDALVPLQMEQAIANIELTQANKAKAESETSYKQKETDWLDRLNAAKERSMSASARLDEGQYQLLSTQKSEMIANIEKLQREADTEIERQFYYESLRMLNEASVREINSLLPLKAAYLSAQTENQKAQAGLAIVHQMYQKGLIDQGYIDCLIKKVNADIEQSNASAAASSATARKVSSEADRSEVKNAILSGDYEGSVWSHFWKRAALYTTDLIPGASSPLDR